MKIVVNLWSHLTQFFLKWRMFQTKFVEKIETHFSCSIMFSENCAFYDIKWKIIVEPDRPHTTIWCMRIACWITNATVTHNQSIKYLLLLYCNNKSTKAPYWYVMLTLLVLQATCAWGLISQFYIILVSGQDGRHLVLSVPFLKMRDSLLRHHNVFSVCVCRVMSESEQCENFSRTVTWLLCYCWLLLTSYLIISYNQY